MTYRKNKIVLISLFALGAAAVFLFLAFSHSGAIHKHEPSVNISGSGSHRLENFSFTEYIKTHNSVQKKFTIEGKKMGMESKRFGFLQIAPAKIIGIKDAKLTFYENDTPISIVTAKKAVSAMPFNVKTSIALAKRIDFFGKVALITEDKRSLACDELKWDNEKNCLVASGNCILRYEGKVMRADSIRTDVKLRRFTE